MRGAGLHVAACPHAQLDARAVLDAHAAGGGQLDVAVVLGQVAVLVVDVADHVLVRLEVAGGQHHAARARVAHVAVVVLVARHDRHHAPGVVLLEVLGVRVEVPRGAFFDGLLAVMRHDHRAPFPIGAAARDGTVDDGGLVELVAGGVHDHAVVGFGRVDVHAVGVVVEVGVHLVDLGDAPVHDLSGVVDEVADETLVAAVRVAHEPVRHEIDLVDAVGTVLDRPLAVDDGHLAADVEEAVLGLRFHDADARPVHGCRARRPGSRLAAAHHHDVEGAAVGDLRLVDRLGRGAPVGRRLALPAMLGLRAAVGRVGLGDGRLRAAPGQRPCRGQAGDGCAREEGAAREAAVRFVLSVRSVLVVLHGRDPFIPHLGPPVRRSALPRFVVHHARQRGIARHFHQR